MKPVNFVSNDLEQQTSNKGVIVSFQTQGNSTYSCKLRYWKRIECRDTQSSRTCRFVLVSFHLARCVSILIRNKSFKPPRSSAAVNPHYVDRLDFHTISVGCCASDWRGMSSAGHVRDTCLPHWNQPETLNGRRLRFRTEKREIKRNLTNK